MYSKPNVQSTEKHQWSYGIYIHSQLRKCDLIGQLVWGFPWSKSNFVKVAGKPSLAASGFIIQLHSECSCAKARLKDFSTPSLAYAKLVTALQ